MNFSECSGSLSRYEQAADRDRKANDPGAGQIWIFRNADSRQPPFMRHPDGRTTTMPVHGKETPGPGLPGKILRDTELMRDDLSALL